MKKYRKGDKYLLKMCKFTCDYYVIWNDVSQLVASYSDSTDYYYSEFEYFYNYDDVRFKKY